MNCPIHRRETCRNCAAACCVSTRRFWKWNVRISERDFGRLTSGELLQLVINHAQFAWLRLISALVVQIDEMLDADRAGDGE